VRLYCRYLLRHGKILAGACSVASPSYPGCGPQVDEVPQFDAGGAPMAGSSRCPEDRDDLDLVALGQRAASVNV